MTVVHALLLLSLCGYAFASEDTVNVTVYFESYCPDSVKFITKQLYPAYQTQLMGHMNITLVPYGLAKKDQNDTIKCHHGENECFGNKVIGCVLHQISITGALKFVNCTSTMISADPKREKYPISECIMGTGLDASAVQQCANGTDGMKYLEEYGDLTGKLSPPISSVPTVVFNEKFDATVSKEAVANFQKSLCDKLKNSSGLAECTRNSAGELQSALLPLMAAVVVSTRL